MQNLIFSSSTTSLALQILLAATLWIGFAVLVNAVLFRASAATRHRLWIVALFGLVVLPIFSAVLPHWFPARWTSTMEVSTKIEIPYEIDSSNIEDFYEKREKAEEPYPIMYVNHPPMENATISTVKIKPPQKEPVFSFSVLPWSSFVGVFLGIWIVGVLGFLGHLAISIRVVHRKLAALEPFCEFSNDPILEQIYRKMQLRRPIRILKNDSETVPFTFGAFRSVIVLPQEATRWNESQKRTIFTHETAHIARRDPFWQIFTHAVCALYWFHPLVWFAAHRIRIERELACDDTVVLRGEKPSTYAEVLLELAMRLKSVSKSSFADNCTVAILKKNVLKNRIRSLLNPKVCRTPLGRVGTGVFLVAAICGVLLTATISPFAQQKNEKTEQESVKAEPAAAEKQNDEKTPYEKVVEKIELTKQKREAIAIPADAKPITLRGRVLNPDGSPAPIAMVCIKTSGVYKKVEMPKEIILPNGHKSVPDSSSLSYQSRFKVTDKEGYFALEKEVLLGANVFLYAFSSEKPATEISNSISFIAREDREDITLQLQKAVPVQGQVAYGDGKPAIEQVVEGKRYIPFLIGADVFEPENFTWNFQTKTDENGFYTLYLPPGEFTIRYLPREEARSRKESAFDKTLSKKIIVPKYGESENDPRVDFQLPTPFRARVVKEDGSALGTFYPYLLTRTEDSTSSVPVKPHGISDEESTLTVVYPPKQDARIYILSLDKLWGAVFDVPEEKRNELQTITLKPSATAKLRVLDKTSNEPVPNIEVSIRFTITSKNGINSYGASTDPQPETDENGIVTFRIPPGTGDYTFEINQFSQLKKKQLTVEPNETIDLGDLILTPAPSPYTKPEPKKTEQGTTKEQDELQADLQQAQKEMEIIQKKRDAIAVPADAKPITVRGRVLNPDGSPVSYGLVRSLSSGSYIKSGTSPIQVTLPSERTLMSDFSPKHIPGWIGGQYATDKDGYFTLNRKITPGANIFLYAFSSTKPITEISNIVSFVAREDREDITLQLQKGVPVSGHVFYEDGQPAINQYVSGRQNIPLLIGADVFDPNDFALDFQTKTDAKGFYTLYLPPGEFRIRYLPTEIYTQEESAFDKTLSKKIIVPKYGGSDNDPVVDLKLPTPFRARVVKEDGSVLDTFYTEFLTRTENSTSLVRVTPRKISDKESVLAVIYPPEQDALVYIRSLDKLWGAIVEVPNEKRYEPQTITLKPTATAKLRVLDKSNKPVPEIEVSMSFAIKSKDGKKSFNSMSKSSRDTHIPKTDENGIITFRIPSKTGNYIFTADLFTKLEKTQLTAQPNENVDLGDVILLVRAKKQEPEKPEPKSPQKETASQKAKEENEIYLKKMEAIAIPEGTQPVTLRGRVVNPDGSPAVAASVKFKRVGVYAKLPVPFNEKTKTLSNITSTDSRTTNTDKDGYFTFGEIFYPGANVFLYAYSAGGHQTKISNPVSLIPKEDPEEITLELQETVPVHGQVVYRDGQPAVNQIIAGKRFIPLLVGADVLNPDHFVLDFQTKTNENGNYTLYLPPGEFTILYLPSKDCIDPGASADQILLKELSRKITVPDTRRVDFKLPMPLRGRIVKEDGSDLEDFQMISQIRSETSAWDIPVESRKTSNKEVDFTAAIYPPQQDVRLTILTDDKLWGAVVNVPDEKREEFQTITLKPTATGKLRVLDKASNKPISGTTVFMGMSMLSRDGKMRYGGRVDLPEKTDENGIATFRIPPGTGDYFFYVDRSMSDYVDRSMSEKTQLTVEPNETIDLGDVFLATTASPAAKQEREKPEPERAKTEPAPQEKEKPSDNKDESEPYAKRLLEWRQKMEKIAIPENAPKITLRGRVVNPDGSAAQFAYVKIQTLGAYQKSGPPDYVKDMKKTPEKTETSPSPTYQTRSMNTTRSSGKDGNFTFDNLAQQEANVQPGANILLYAYSSEKPPKLISNPVTFVSQENPEEITIELQKAVPVRGQLLYEDGPPVAKQLVKATQQVPYLIGEDVFDGEHIRDNFSMDFQSNTDENGFYTFYLPPGEFTIQYLPLGDDPGFQRSWSINTEFFKSLSKKITVPKFGENAEELRGDLKIPTPLRGRIVKEDGGDLGFFQTYFHIRSDIRAINIPFQSRRNSTQESIFETVYPPESDARISILTENKRWGAVVDVPNEKRGEFQTITLKPSATAKLRVLDKTSNEPIAGIDVSMSFQASPRDGHYTFSQGTHPIKTDDEGIATFHIPPGTGDYKFQINEQSKLEKKQWTVEPNETIELGDIFRDSQDSP